MENKQVRLKDRWAQDTGVAFYDEDGKEEVVTDKRKMPEIEIIEEVKEDE